VDYQLKETTVLDNIIPKDLQDKFHDLVMSQSFKFLKDMSYADGDIKYPSYGFNFLFKHPQHGIMSPLYETVCVPIVNALLEELVLKVNDIYYTRAFLQVPLADNFYKGQNGAHIDIPDPHYACVYYMNDSDGDTIIYEQNIHDTPPGSKHIDLVEHKRVTPKKGRIAIFDGARYHCSSQPRENYRCIINFVLV